MQYTDICIYKFLLLSPVVAMVVFLLASLYYCVLKSGQGVRNINSATVMFRNKKLFMFTGLAIIDLLMLFTAGKLYINDSALAAGSVSVLQVAGEGLMITLKSLGGMDDFGSFISSVRDVFAASVTENQACVDAFVWYAGIIGIFAPLTSLAFVIDVLTTFLPKLKLRLSYLIFFRKKYYFSELNAGSLELAKNIIDDNKKLFGKPIIVFTDVRVSSENDKATELVLEARAIGAYCIRDDIMHVPKSAFGQRKIFLIDENEAENIHKLAELSSDSRNLYLKKAEIYLFCADGVYDKVRDGVISKLSEGFGKKNAENMPSIIPVYVYRNLAASLLDKLPVYEPVIHEVKPETETDVYFTVLGTGKIGTEMFLAAYRTAQMLGIRLHLTVVSDESESDFRGRIDYINPDIFDTSVAGHPILAVNDKGDVNEPYFRFSYTQKNITSGNMHSLLDENIRESNAKIRDSHYFVVALGSDAYNIAVAEKLRQQISEYHLDNRHKKTVIAYAVYDSELCDMFNRSKFCKSFSNDVVDIYMHAFGNLSEEYSTENILMKDKMSVMSEIHHRYENSDKAVIKELSKKQKRAVASKLLQDEYGYSSDIARTMHINYKLFSAGLISCSIFDCDGDLSAYNQAYNEALMKYAKTDFIADKAERLEMFHKLAWLEHRRWCADLRTRGFRSSSHIVFSKTHSHKNLDLRLQSCLVECDMRGIRGAEYDDDCHLLNDTQKEMVSDESYDKLDLVTYAVREKNPEKENFKKYDYIKYDPLIDYMKDASKKR